MDDDFDIQSSLYQNRISQNPLMHLFESFVFAYEVLHNEIYKDAATKILDIVYQNFYNAEVGAIMEMSFEEDLAYWYEPGHSFEWGSLLKIAESQQVSHEIINAVNLVGVAEKVTENFGQIVPAKVKIPGNEIESTFRIWASLERVRVHFMLENFELANSGLEEALNKFFDNNNLPKEFLDMAATKVKSTSGYHIINCLQEAIKWCETTS